MGQKSLRHSSFGIIFSTRENELPFHIYARQDNTKQPRIANALFTIDKKWQICKPISIVILILSYLEKDERV